MLAIRARQVFDGERLLAEGSVVLVDEGRIAGVQPGETSVPAEFDVAEFPQATLLPGLIDAHVHLCADGGLEHRRRGGRRHGAASRGPGARRPRRGHREDHGKRRGQHTGQRREPSAVHGRGDRGCRHGGPRRRPAGHCPCPRSRRHPTRAGCRSRRPRALHVHHRNRIDVDDAVVASLVESAIPVCPTLGFVPGAQPSPAVRELLRKAESTNQSRPQIVARLHHAGVRLVAGLDAGISPGKPHGVLAESLLHLAGGEVSTTDVVASATSIAAEACGLTDRKGRLAPGLDADLLLLDGDPLADITSLRNVEAVYLRGRRVV